MYISAPTLDDLLRHVYEKLLKSRNHIQPSKGSATEFTGVLLKLSDPRCRLSRTEVKGTLFSCLGEFSWYLAGSNELGHITHYLPDYTQFSDDGVTTHGAYGPRLFGTGKNGQVQRIISLLKEKPDSRQAVIQLFGSADLMKKYKDVPCTCTMQFMVRHGRLHMLTTMRSNDVYLGLPHDVFSFTMLQEIIARSLGMDVGPYKHAVGSLHLYDKHREKVEQYLEEGWQMRIPMPSMPSADPWGGIRSFLEAERAIRLGEDLPNSMQDLDPYWADLIRILQIFKYTNDPSTIRKASGLIRKMHSNVYAPYIKKRHTQKMLKHKIEPEQLEIFPEQSEKA